MAFLEIGGVGECGGRGVDEAYDGPHDRCNANWGV